MEVIDWVFIALGVFCIGWGIFNRFKKKFSKERLEKYTIESLTKYANIESILTMVSGVGIIVAGLANSGEVLPQKPWLYIGWVIVVVVLVVEFIIEPKILKKIENTEDKK